MSKHIRVKYKGLHQRRRNAAEKLYHALGERPTTLTAARKLWRALPTIERREAIRTLANGRLRPTP